MKYILFVLLLGLAAAGDLATSNCPASFNISAANVTTDAQKSLVSSMTPFYNFVRGANNADALEAAIIKGSPLDSYLFQMAILFIVIGAFFLLTYCIIVACCVFQKSCPPCKSWQRDFVKRPYEKSELRCVTYSMLIFMVITMGIAVAAFTSLPALQESTGNTKCGIYTILDIALNGDGVSWGGFSTIASLLDGISSALSSTQTKINTYFGDNTWLTNDTLSMQNKNMNLYNNYNASTVVNPDADNVTQVMPLFISSGLGPNGTANRMVTDIDAGMQVTQVLTNSAIQVDQSAKVLADSVSTIQSNVNISKNQLNMYNSQLASFEKEMNAFSSQYFDQIFQWGVYAMEGIVGFILAACLMGIAGGIATHFFDMYNCRTMVHLSWGILGLMYFGVLVMTYAFLPAGSIGMDMCKVYNKALTNQTYFRKFGEQYSQSVTTKIEVCLFGDGAILNTFNSLNEMSTISQMFTNIKSFQQMRNSSSSSYVDLTTSTGKVSGWMAAMLNFRDGIYDDAPSTLTSKSNPKVALYNLNGYTLRAAGAQNCSQDDWVFDEANCTTGEAKYVPGTTIVEGTTLRTYPLCISFNSKLMTSSTSVWTTTDFNARYVQIMANCSTAYSNIMKYGFALINFRDSRINLYKSLYSDLNDLLTANLNFNTKLGTF